jgi:hypothetical protein
MFIFFGSNGTLLGGGMLLLKAFPVTVGTILPFGTPVVINLAIHTPI